MNIEPLAIALHAAFGKHAAWPVLSDGMKWRYRNAAKRLLTELEKVEAGIYFRTPNAS